MPLNAIAYTARTEKGGGAKILYWPLPHSNFGIAMQARTQDFEKGGSGYRVAIRPRRGGGCGHEAFTLWMI